MTEATEAGGGTVGHVLGETRWRILGELCRRRQTAAELATAVETSANAVRVHLDALQRAGLVSFSVERGKVGKPAHVYALTAAGESLVSKAYAPALAAILVAARAKMNGGFLPMLREAGATLGAAVDQDSKIEGPEAAKRLLESLGGPVDLDQTNGAARLSANCCPLAAVTRNMPELCNMMAAALETTSGMSATVQCTHGAHPRCAFEMTNRSS